MGGCGSDVALYGFDVRLKGAFDPLTFNYLLRVRHKDRARFIRRRAGEGDVGEIPESTPLCEVTGTRF